METFYAIEHPAIREAFRTWLVEHGLYERAIEKGELSRLALSFTDGWGSCLNQSMGPAVELAMVVMQIASVVERNASKQVVLDPAILRSLKELGEKVVGQPEQWQLDETIEPRKVTAAEAKQVLRKSVTNEIVGMLNGLADNDERLEILSAIRLSFCTGCGRFDRDDTRRCQCDNDE